MAKKAAPAKAVPAHDKHFLRKAIAKAIRGNENAVDLEVEAVAAALAPVVTKTAGRIEGRAAAIGAQYAADVRAKLTALEEERTRERAELEEIKTTIRAALDAMPPVRLAESARRSDRDAFAAQYRAGLEAIREAAK